MEDYLKQGNIIEGIQEGNRASAFSKEALLYFRQYQRIRFLIYLSIMWLGWIVLLFLRIAGIKRRYLRTSLLLLINIGFMSLLIITLIGYLGNIVTRIFKI